jgi:hypothetical protein
MRILKTNPKEPSPLKEAQGDVAQRGGELLYHLGIAVIFMCYLLHCLWLCIDL